MVQLRDPSAADPWHLPATEFTKAPIIVETGEGVVATVECAPETVGDPAGGWVRIGQAPVTPEARASVRNGEVVGGPMVTVTAGRVSVRRVG